MRGADQISVVEFSGSETLDAFIPAAGGAVPHAGRLRLEQSAIAICAIRPVGPAEGPSG